MIFEKDKYYKYIHQLETFTQIINILIIGIAVIIGLAKGLLLLIILVPSAMLISWGYLIRTKIRIQEMKWKFDCYNRIIEKL